MVVKKHLHFSKTDHGKEIETTEMTKMIKMITGAPKGVAIPVNKVLINILTVVLIIGASLMVLEATMEADGAEATH